MPDLALSTTGAAAAPSMKPIAVILPHREVFQRVGAGAVSLCVSHITGHSAYRGDTLILGEPVAEALAPEQFRPVARCSWIYGRRANRYLKGVTRAIRSPPGLLEIHNRPAYVPSLQAAFPDTPLLLYVHNDPRTMRGWRRREQRARALETLSAVVCVSEYIRRCMLDGLEDHPHRHKVHVVLNGVDTTALTPHTPKRREMIFVGRLSPQKGALIFAQAALLLQARLPDWHFVIVGARSFGTGAMGSDYERLVAETMSRLGARGEITGYLPHMQAMARLQEAAIAVMPAQWDDPCPLSIIEAMACGCAVAAGPHGGIPELIGDTGLLIDSSDAAAWADGLHGLAGDTERQGRYQQAARRRASGMLDIRHCTSRLDAVRTTLLHGPGRGAGDAGR